MAELKRISINQQMAEIGIHNTSAKMNINHPRMTMRVKNEMPQLEIEKATPKFRVNRRKLNAEMNLHTPGDFTKQRRNIGKSAVLKGIKAAGDDGDLLGNAKIKGQKIGRLARNKAMNAAIRKKEANIELMPAERPEIIWDKGSMSINWSKHSLVIDWDGDYMPQLTIDPKYSIELFLRTEPYFKITIEELASLGISGQHIDRAI